jgi:polyphosphate kinase 2 (PPK2 family)
MPTNATPLHDELIRRIREDLMDSYDEELEMELEDRSMTELEAAASGIQTEAERMARRQYFQELFRLQGELVKLQDWVVRTRHKVVILFEGRDAAGKGGVIKRITQRLTHKSVIKAT